MSLNTILATAPLTTQNYILKATGTTIGNSLIFDNGTNVGIGNTNTTYKLDVSGTGNFTGALSGTSATFSSSVNVVGTLIAGNASNVGKVEIGSVGSSSTAQASAYLRIGDEGAARFWLQQLNSSYDFTIRHFNSSWSSSLLTITSAGNVGIGTNSPATKLHVNTTSTAENVIKVTNATLDLTLGVNTDSGGSFVFENSNNALRFGTNATERMRITSGGVAQFTSGSTGATVTNLNSALSGTQDISYAVGRTLNTQGSAFFGWRYNSAAASSYGFIETYGGSSPLVLQGSGGNVLIGTSTDGGYKLEVVGTFKVGGSAYFTGSVYNYVGANRFFASGGTINYLYSGSASLNLVNQADTGTIGTFNGTTGVYTATSDINKKKDFEPSTIGLNEVLQLKPTLYRMKSEDESSPKQLGFIAQEVKSLINNSVSEKQEYIPNIYDMVDISINNDGKTLLTCKNKNIITFDTTENTTMKIKLYDAQDKIINVTLDQIVSDNSFTINENLTEEVLFAYGQEVKDFNVLNKDAVWTIATAALQEVDRQHQATQQQLAETKQRLDALEAFIQSKFP